MTNRHFANLNRIKQIFPRLVKESTSIPFQMKYMVEDIILEPFGIVDLHLRNQECPPVSGRVPDRSKIYLFQTFEIIRSLSMVGTTLGCCSLLLMEVEMSQSVVCNQINS